MRDVTKQTSNMCLKCYFKKKLYGITERAGILESDLSNFMLLGKSLPPFSPVHKA